MRKFIKQLIASVFDLVGINHLCFRIHRMIFPSYIRVVNYHGTPSFHAQSFECQLRYLQSTFVCSTPEHLQQAISKKWNYSKPGLVLSFDDGLKNNISVAVPLLEKYGFKAIFFVPPGFIDEPTKTTAAYCRRNMINGTESFTREDLLYLARNHFVGSHSYDHIRLSNELTRAQVRREVVDSKSRLEELTGKAIRYFGWVGGEEWSYGRLAASEIKSSGYDYSFVGNSFPVTESTDPLWIHRTNLEASWPLPMVRFQLCGIPDLWHWASRRRIRTGLL